MAEQKTWYYGIVYFDNGEASVSGAFETKEKCVEETKKGIIRKPTRVMATTYITRKSEKPIPLTKLFGCPNSRNLMKDTKFMLSLTEGK